MRYWSCLDHGVETKGGEGCKTICDGASNSIESWACRHKTSVEERNKTSMGDEKWYHLLYNSLQNEKYIINGSNQSNSMQTGWNYTKYCVNGKCEKQIFPKSQILPFVKSKFKRFSIVCWSIWLWSADDCRWPKLQFYKWQIFFHFSLFFHKIHFRKKLTILLEFWLFFSLFSSKLIRFCIFYWFKSIMGVLLYYHKSSNIVFVQVGSWTYSFVG